MKVASSLKTLKNRHPDCKVVRRKGRLYVINKTNPRFKARQGWLADFYILQMKKGIHPVLNPVSFVDVSTGKKFNTVSTASSKKTENIDGVDHHILVRDITMDSHPAFTGEKRFVDTAGRVEKFQNKFSRKRSWFILISSAFCAELNKSG